MSNSCRSGLLISLFALLGCDAQASPAYLGEALLTISGSVEIDSERDRGKLVPALAFFSEQSSALHIVETEVEGEFPSDFVLRVYTPPPDATIEASDERPPAAIGYITAVTEDHPDSIRYARDVSGGGVCSANDGDQVPLCEYYDEWCPSDGGECYMERRRCPHSDSPLEDCEILESSGDPSLRQDPWESFAGLSDYYRIVYLPEAVEDDIRLTAAVGLSSLSAGYHLFELRPSSAEELAAAEQCHGEAETLATDRYNEAHGTSFGAQMFFGAYVCMDPIGDMPVPGADPGSAGSGDDGPPFMPASPGSGLPTCGEVPTAEARKEANTLLLEAIVELECPPEGVSVRYVEDPTSEHISVRIGPDVEPAF